MARRSPVEVHHNEIQRYNRTTDPELYTLDAYSSETEGRERRGELQNEPYR